MWASVADKAAAYQVDSPTLAMADVYEETAPRLNAYAAAFRAEPGQRGAVVAIDGKPVGVELFDSPATFTHYLDRLVSSYALDAMETAGSVSVTPSEDAARRFVESIATAACDRFPALGEGDDLRLSGEGITGGALAVDGRLVHLAGLALA